MKYISVPTVLFGWICMTNDCIGAEPWMKAPSYELLILFTLTSCAMKSEKYPNINFFKTIHNISARKGKVPAHK
jgi:hypothetical protein